MKWKAGNEIENRSENIISIILLNTTQLRQIARGLKTRTLSSDFEFIGTKSSYFGVEIAGILKSSL